MSLIEQVEDLDPILQTLVLLGAATFVALFYAAIHLVIGEFRDALRARRDD